MRVAGLLGANVLLLVAGLGLLPLLGLARSWRELLFRSGLAYLCGIAACGILAAHLALVHVPFGWIALAVTAAALGGAGCSRLRATERPLWRLPGLVPLAGVVALAVLLAQYARAFAVAPLNRYDAWAIWSLKGHALSAFGWADPAVFAAPGSIYPHPEYPLFLPSLEATDFRAMGAFDTRLLHLQFLLLLIAGLAALWALLRDRVPPLLLWPSLLAIAAAPSVFDHLLTAYADVPLGLFFAVGAAAAGRWLVTDERWALAVATLLFGATLLLKNEGSLFVLAAFLGLAVAARTRLGALVIAAAADLALLLPWKIYTAVHHLHATDFRFLDSFDASHLSGRLGIGPIAFRTLGENMLDPSAWGLLLPLAALAVVAALVAGVRGLPLYTVLLAGISWLGLSWIYVISDLSYGNYLDSTKDRVVISVVLACAALTPLLAAETWRAHRLSGPGPAPPPSGVAPRS